MSLTNKKEKNKFKNEREYVRSFKSSNVRFEDLIVKIEVHLLKKNIMFYVFSF